MKLFTKISFIVAVVALGLGIIGVCAGMAMGADAGDLSEMGIYISPHHQMEIKKFTEDDMEDIIEEAAMRISVKNNLCHMIFS